VHKHITDIFLSSICIRCKHTVSGIPGYSGAVWRLDVLFVEPKVDMRFQTPEQETMNNNVPI
jgi:hypothetical protein